MTSLTVFYDGQCDFCRRCRAWLEAQPKYLHLRFQDRRDSAVMARWGGLIGTLDDEELVVVSNDGKVYRGGKAWVMCLYALRAWRPLALRLGSPGMFGLARRVFSLISHHRHHLPRWLLRSPDAEVVHLLTQVAEPPSCQLDGTACGPVVPGTP